MSQLGKPTEREQRLNEAAANPAGMPTLAPNELLAIESQNRTPDVLANTNALLAALSACQEERTRGHDPLCRAERLVIKGTEKAPEPFLPSIRQDSTWQAAN